MIEIGTRIAKLFAGQGLYFGTVSVFHPASTSGTHENMWGIEYDDGDYEDMYQWEVEAAHKEHSATSVPRDVATTGATASSTTRPSTTMQTAARGALLHHEDTTRRVTMSPPLPNEAISSRAGLSSCDQIIVKPEILGQPNIHSSSNVARMPTRGPQHNNVDSDDDSDDDIDLKPTFRSKRIVSLNQFKANLKSESRNDLTVQTNRIAPRRIFIPLESDSSSDEEDILRSRRKRKATERNLVITPDLVKFDEGKLGVYGDSYDDDDDDEVLVIESSDEDSILDQLTTSKRLRRSKMKNDDPPTPPKLTKSLQEEKLGSIEDEADRYLQLLLFQAGFQFTLLEHQFEAVRKIAGLPHDFPVHPGSHIFTPSKVNISAAVKGLNNAENLCKTKGLLLADEMGLGKTVEAIAGAILRNEIAAANGEKKRPTAIVSPNDAVQRQWRETLHQNGVSLKRIYDFKKGQTEGLEGDTFVLMTRYSLQSEVKELFGYLDSDKPARTSSALFPHAQKINLTQLQNQYLADKGKRANLYRHHGENTDHCITRLFRNCAKSVNRRVHKVDNFAGTAQEAKKDPVFELVLIDEAHLMKNKVCYWTMGAALMCIHAKRRVPLTGTPYNNGPSDIACVNMYIDESKSFSTKSWWDTRVGGNRSLHHSKSVTEWRKDYLLRRLKADVLKGQLPPKNVQNVNLSLFPGEMEVYCAYEGQLMVVLSQFVQLMGEDSNNPLVKQQLREIHTIIMALMSNMRSANIHNMVPGGREYTKQFSPSRRHLVGTENRPNVCVYCCQSMHPTVRIDDDSKDKVKKRRINLSNARARRIEMNLEDDELDDEADDLVEDEEEEDEELEMLPAHLCHARNSAVKHYAHGKCIEKMLAPTAEVDHCPRCADIKNRVSFDLPNGVTYCKNISVAPGIEGFTASSKLNVVIDWYREEVPKEDKTIILSFFKGGLDLLEGIFVEEFGIDCARFDGDVSKNEKNDELHRFKTDPSCKVLFATVQSGGVGLNIVEANHVAFLDRWFNPFVHAQAEDRVYRIGQTKDVHIRYFDCAATIDQVMVAMNDAKKNNSKVLLADGFDIGNESGNFSYTELSGMLGRLICGVRSFRAQFETERRYAVTADKILPAVPIPAMSASALQALMDGPSTLAMLANHAAGMNGDIDDNNEDFSSSSDGDDD